MKTLYLLTGAAGFLGSNICSQLLERGDRVRAFVLKGDPAVQYIPKGVEIFEGDLCSPEDCQRFFDVEDDMETVCIHCASMVTVKPDYSEKLIAVNVGGTENILAAAKAHPECRKLVYVSSTGAIPELPKGQAIREVDQFVPYDDDRVVGWYSRSKAIATQRVLDAAREGLNACVVHPSGILGPNDHAISETTGTVIKIMNGEMPVGMGGSFNLCDVRDLAAGTIAAADKGRRGECYILGNKEVTLKEVAHMLHDACGCKQPLFYVPISMAYRLAESMEKKAAKTGEKPMMTKFAVYNLDRNNRFDYSKAERELGYHTRPYAETLRDEARWLVAAGKIKGNVHLDEAEKKEPSLEEKLLSTMESRTLIQRVAEASSAQALDQLLQVSGITGYSPEDLQMSYQAIELSRNAIDLFAIFDHTDYGTCVEKMEERGIKITPEEFDLIRDILACVNDTEIGEEIDQIDNSGSAALLLRSRGYYHITKGFLDVLYEYSNLLAQVGLVPGEETDSQRTFEDRCAENINTLCAVGVIAALKFGVQTPFSPSYLIAISGAAAVVQRRVNE